MFLSCINVRNVTVSSSLHIDLRPHLLLFLLSSVDVKVTFFMYVMIYFDLFLAFPLRFFKFANGKFA